MSNREPNKKEDSEPKEYCPPKDSCGACSPYSDDSFRTLPPSIVHRSKPLLPNQKCLQNAINPTINTYAKPRSSTKPQRFCQSGEFPTTISRVFTADQTRDIDLFHPSKKESRKSVKEKEPQKYRKRVKYDPVILRRILDVLKEEKKGLITKLKDFLGLDIHRHLSQGFSFSIESHEKLKEFIKFNLGDNILIAMFGQDDIPHILIIGLSEEIELADNEDISEILSIFNGDGNIDDKTFSSHITLNGIDEGMYVEHVRDLLEQLFPGKFKFEVMPGKAVRFRSMSQSVHHYLISKGLIPGDKVKNQIGVHPLAFRNEKFAIAALKGLFDTDGAISLEKSQKKLSLTFVSASKPLVEDFKKLCVLIGIKTGDVNGPYYVIKDQDPYWHARIAAKSEVNKFFTLVNPEKFKERSRRLYYGTRLIIVDILPNNILKEVNNQILRDYPQQSDRRYSKEFALYLKGLCEKIFFRHGCNNIYGIPFTDKITVKMTDIALQQAVRMKQVAFTRDGSSVSFIEWDLKFKFSELIVEIFLKEKNSPLTLLSHNDIFKLLGKKLYDLNNYELINIFSNPNKRYALSQYLQKRIDFIKALYEAAQLGESLSLDQAKRRYNINQNDYYPIVRFLKKMFPNEFGFS